MVHLLNLLAAIALLVWGTQIVRTGILRVFGENLRHMLAVGMSSRPKALIAGLAHDNPEFCWPELSSRQEHPYFEAEALGHPLIPASKRVCNDVAMNDGARALLVTGSNMSGKSTLLRAVGVAAVLALAGGPACARRLRLSRLSVCTSMRVSDSLQAGVSHFYAELGKLKQVLDALFRGKPRGEPHSGAAVEVPALRQSYGDGRIDRPDLDERGDGDHFGHEAAEELRMACVVLRGRDDPVAPRPYTGLSPRLSRLRSTRSDPLYDHRAEPGHG